MVPVLLGGLFLASGAGKLVSPTGAARLVRNLADVGQQMAVLMVRSVAIAELCAVLLLGARGTRFTAGLLSLVLGVIISAVSLLIGVNGARVPCGCFGTTKDGSPIGMLHAAVGGAIACGSVLVLLGGDPVAIDQDLYPPIVACVTVGFMLIIRWQQVLSPWSNLTRRQQEA